MAAPLKRLVPAPLGSTCANVISCYSLRSLFDPQWVRSRPAFGACPFSSLSGLRRVRSSGEASNPMVLSSSQYPACMTSFCGRKPLLIHRTVHVPRPSSEVSVNRWPHVGAVRPRPLRTDYARDTGKVLQLQEVGGDVREDESAVIGGPGLRPSQKEPVCLRSVPRTLRLCGCMLISGGGASC